MSRIAGCFAELATARRRALIPYIVAGDPEPGLTVPLMHALVRGGADIIELGVPFSDPMSEGPVIQLAHERALAGGTRLRQVLDMVRDFRREDATTPVLLMGYANPVERMGYVEFADAAREAGLDALLTVDIPPEEVADLNSQLQRVEMDNIFLIAPTTPERRIERIVPQASGFIYCVALKGVTGAAHLDTAGVAEQVAMIRRTTTLPVAVGFGIKDAQSAAAVAGVADGVVVGSALVDRIAVAQQQGLDPVAEAMEMVADIRSGIDGNVAS